MTHRVFNFGAGPSGLPTEVMEQAQAELLDYRGMGVSVLEISHRSPEFEAILAESDQLIRELSGLPDNYHILYMQGGANLQFSAVPLNLVQRSATATMQYVNSGNFAGRAIKEAERYGSVDIVASSADSQFDRIPELDVAGIDPASAYLHITSNNTLFGTRWQQFPDTGAVPLVADMTSELFSRVVDYRQFGVVYAGFQKNLGPAGMALVLIRDDLLGDAMPHTPNLLNYGTMAADHSLTNTTNTFAIYMLKLMLEWKQRRGGIAALEAINEQKAALLYKTLDQSAFYRAVAHPEHRSTMNVAFHLAVPDAEKDRLQQQFLTEALAHDLYALKGHKLVGGLRASIYNAMPLAGVQALVEFMLEFERTRG